MRWKRDSMQGLPDVAVATRTVCFLTTPSVSGIKRLAPLPTHKAGDPKLALGGRLYHEYVRLAA